MSTGDKKVNLTLKKFLSQQEITDNFLELVLKGIRDIYKRVYPIHGVFNGGELSASTVDSFDIATPLQGSDGQGNDLVLDAADANDIPFPNVNDVEYFVGLKKILIPDGTIETNQRTGKQQYRLLEEKIGLLADPTSVVDDTGNMIINVNSLFASGQDHSGRTVKVFLKATQDGGTVGPLSAALAVETLTTTFVAGNNLITTATALGQTSISTTASDYQVALIGPIVTTTDITSDTDKIILGSVDGNAPGQTPDVFDNAIRFSLLAITQSNELGFLNQQQFILAEGGTITHKQGSVGAFWWTAAIKIKPLGFNTELAIASIIEANAFQLDDDEVAFVPIPSPFSGGTPTMQKATRLAFATENQANYWIAYRSGSVITFRDGMQLEEGEARQLSDLVVGNFIQFDSGSGIQFTDSTNEFRFDADGIPKAGKTRQQEVLTGNGGFYSPKSSSAISAVNGSMNEVFDQTRYRELLRVESNTSSTIVDIGEGRFSLTTGEEVGVINDLGDVVVQADATVDFGQATIVNSDGDNDGAFNPTVDFFFKYGIALDNVGDIVIIQPSGEAATASAAPEPNFAGFTMPLAVVTCEDNGSGNPGTIENIIDEDILMIRKYPLQSQPASVKYQTELTQDSPPNGESFAKTFDYEIKVWDSGDGAGGDLVTNVVTAVPSVQSVICAAVDGGGGANYNGNYFIYEDGGFRRVLWFDIDDSGTTIPAGASTLVALGYIAEEVTSINSGDSGTDAAAALVLVINGIDWEGTNNRGVTATNATATLTITHLGGGRRELLDASNIAGMGTENETTPGTGTFFTAKDPGIYRYYQQISMEPAPNENDDHYLAVAVNKIIIDRVSTSFDPGIVTDVQGQNFSGLVELNADDKLDFRFLTTEPFSTLKLRPHRFANYFTIEKVREKVN